MKFPENLAVLDCPEMAQAYSAEWDSIQRDKSWGMQWQTQQLHMNFL